MAVESEEKKGLGNVLRQLRMARELSVKNLAERMGVSSTYISEVESNNKNPSLDMLNKYSDALEVKLSTIMAFNEEGEQIDYDFKKMLLLILQEIVEK